MEKADAEVLVRTYLDFGFLFGLATERSQVIGEDAGKQLRRAMAEAMFRLDDNFMNEVRSKYPDLVPADLR